MSYDPFVPPGFTRVPMNRGEADVPYTCDYCGAVVIADTASTHKQFHMTDEEREDY